MNDQKKDIWYWLPGETQPVLAGQFRLETDRGRFTYDTEYLARNDALPLDPISLPLSKKNFAEFKNGGIFGILSDSGPDSWGKGVLNLEHRRELQALECLEYAPGDNVGAIAVGDPARKLAWKPFQISDLDRIAESIEAVQSGLPIALQQILSPDTALGGAKPKVTVEKDGCLWLAKFTERGDYEYMPYLEHAALSMAKDCGVNACESIPGILKNGRQYLLVKRFDREAADNGWVRRGYASAATVLKLGDKGIAEPSRNYVEYGENIRRWCASKNVDAKDQARELWRRIVYNGLINNGDDHPRNHGLVQNGTNWKLSLAFDLAPYPMDNDHRALSMPFNIDRKNNIRTSHISYENLIAASKDFYYTREEAIKTLLKMSSYVLENWRNYVSELPDEVQHKTGKAFVAASILKLEAENEIRNGILKEARSKKGKGE